MYRVITNYIFIMCATFFDLTVLLKHYKLVINNEWLNLSFFYDQIIVHDFFLNIYFFYIIRINELFHIS